MQSSDSGKGYPLPGNMMSRIRNIPLGTETGFHVRERLGNGSSSSSVPVGSLADKLLGTSLGTSPSPTFYALEEETDDLTELKEEDIWDTDLRGRVELPDSKLDAHHTAAVTIPGFYNKEKNLDNGDGVRFFGNGHHGFKDHAGSGSGSFAGSKSSQGRRWTGTVKDGNPVGSLSNLSLAFGGDSGSRGRLAVPSEGFISSSRGIPGAAAAEDGVGGYGNGSSSVYGGGGGGAIPIGGLSSALSGAGKQQQMFRQGPPVKSAPVNVPDWSKILGPEGRKKPVFVDSSDEDDEDGRVPVHRLPPHEILAREAARSQRTTFSVCEGAGRTLKGADLTRVRNAILRQTGFLDGAN